MEKRARREKATKKVASVFSTISPTCSTRKGKKVVTSKGHIYDSIHMLQDCGSSKLLTASAGVDISWGIQVFASEIS